MATIYNLDSDTMEKFEQFSSVTSTTYDANDNMTQVVYTWGPYTKTIDMTYDGSNNLSTTTVTWGKS